jgi:hypothetical protein
VTPTTAVEVGTHTISFKVSDGIEFSLLKVTVTVKVNPPYF